MKFEKNFFRGQRPRSCQSAFEQSVRLYSAPTATSGIGKLVVLLAVALVSSGALAAQQQKTNENEAPNLEVVLSQTVRRVRVDVVVTDAEGRPVGGLQAGDFQVAEEGKQQSVRQFEWHNGESDTNSVPLLPPLPAGTFMNLPTATERGPLTVLFYDVLNTPVNDQLNARALMVQFLKNNKGRRLAIFVLGEQLHIVQGFTSDTSLLARALNAIKPARTSLAADTLLSARGPSQSLVPGPPAPSPPNNGRPGGGSGVSQGMSGSMPDPEQVFSQMMENDEANRASFLLDRRVELTLDAMKQIGRYLSGFEGRKNLIWYSGSFPAGVLPDPVKRAGVQEPGSIVRDDATRNYTDRLRAATDQLTTAEVAVYPVDARGLSGVPINQFAGETGTMDLLAEQTGGRAFYNTNALEQALEMAAADGSSYYSLLYAPTNPKYDGSIRHIKVVLAKSGYRVAYRRTYFADALDVKRSGMKPVQESDPEVEALPSDENFGAPLTHELIFAAHVETVGGPAAATEQQLAALQPYREAMAKAEHRKHPPRTAPPAMQRYAIVYAVLAKLLDMPVSADGAYHSDLSFALIPYDEDGGALWGTKTKLQDSIPQSRIAQIRSDGFRAAQSFFVPVDTAVLRLAVRDGHSGKSGTMEVRLPLGPVAAL